MENVLDIVLNDYETSLKKIRVRLENLRFNNSPKAIRTAERLLKQQDRHVNIISGLNNIN